MLLKLPEYLIKLYRFFISPLLGNHCKYYPSCSMYFLHALKINGYLGLFQGAFRLLRCNPFSHGGFDPVKKIQILKSKVG